MQGLCSSYSKSENVLGISSCFMKWRSLEEVSTLGCNFIIPGLRVGLERNMESRSGLMKGDKKPHAVAWKQKTNVIAWAQGGVKPGGPFKARNSTPADLRRLLDAPGAHQGPACYDALSAKLVERAGFSVAFTSGFSISAARLAEPDVGLMSYGEMLDEGRLITAAVSIPVIGDADTGYGNAMNVKRTVKGYIRAGFAGIILEDQVSPKACGHTEGRKVVPREEAVCCIRAAVDARSESGADIVIVARTDARQAISLEEALWRVQRFAEAGADVLFIDALASKDELQAFANISPNVPKMANMLEGGGCTPILSPMELAEMGFKLIAYPLSLVGVSIRAMQDALEALKSGRLPPPGDLLSFEEIKECVGFNKYYEEEKRYAGMELACSTPEVINLPGMSRPSSPTEEFAYTDKSGNVAVNTSEQIENPSLSRLQYQPEVDNPFNQFSGTMKSLPRVWSTVLRVKVTGSDGVDKLDVRIPAGFLESFANTIPAAAGLNFKRMLDEVQGNEKSGKRLIDITDRRGERFQVFLE